MTKRQAIVQFLVGHPELWAQWPPAPLAHGVLVRMEQRHLEQVQKRCVVALKELRLISRSTVWHDVNLHRYIHEARRLMGTFN